MAYQLETSWQRPKLHMFFFNTKQHWAANITFLYGHQSVQKSDSAFKPVMYITQQKGIKYTVKWHMGIVKYIISHYSLSPPPHPLCLENKNFF